MESASAHIDQAAAARVDFDAVQKIIPEAFTALRAVGHAAAQAGLERDLLELIRIRASQLNACAFCVQFHLNEARKLGVPAAKLDLLATWREAGVFSARESAALAWTERVTLLAQHHIGDDAYNEVLAHFPQRELVFLTAVISQINFWNRLAAPFRFTPPIQRST